MRKKRRERRLAEAESGEKPSPAPPPMTPEEAAEAARIYGEQLYWEDYYERNAD